MKKRAPLPISLQVTLVRRCWLPAQLVQSLIIPENSNDIISIRVTDFEEITGVTMWGKASEHLVGGLGGGVEVGGRGIWKAAV